MASSLKGRAHKLTEKAAALIQERDNCESHRKNPKPSTKGNRTLNKRHAESESSDSSEEGEPCARKRCRRPDSEEIEVGREPSDLEPEIVEEGEDDETVSESKEDDGGAGDTGEDDDIQVIGDPKVSQISPNQISALTVFQNDGL